MRILGIDPGTAITGCGFVNYTPPEAFTEIAYTTITTLSTTPLPQRLLEIHTDLITLIQTYQPQAVAVEKLFFNTNAKTAMSVGQARGVILFTAVQAGIPVFEYTPLQVKQTITGYGRAEKHQIQKMIQSTLKLPTIPKPDDAADALAIAVTHAYFSRTPHS